ncbi:copper resistance CopC/CopD family protein [Demequina mangrovi]|uniref:Copper transport protein n=1 Tax=Demequina mangrovi TaxID=1043493 RepID=A0A1H6YW34_9MICO|nr:CopD family protein [Demequina mangrovi]SEJ45459.1 copper transport protein [Demequina mangrovi]
MRVPDSPGRRPVTGPASALVAVMLALAVVLLSATHASAHTALDSTDPADGATVSGPVDRIVLTFTLPVTILGDGATVAGPEGAVAAEVTQEQEGAVVIATPAEPLVDGEHTVEWTVAAQDGHPLDGTSSFTVVDALPAPTASASATASAGAAASASATPTATPAATATDSTSSSPAPAPAITATDGTAMDDETGDAPATVLARAGSATALWALLVGAGALAFAAIAMRGPDRVDEPRVIAGVRWCGALLLGGLALRIVGRSAVIAGGSLSEGLGADALGDALAGSFAGVAGLQAAGGALMLLGAWRSAAASAGAIAGVLLAGAGHVLGGHSHTAEPRALVLAADIAHLAAAAVWVGGAVTLAAVMRRRGREDRPPAAAAMASRFGVAAAASVVVVGIAGVALTWAIVDEPSDLWTSSWGVTLLVKAGLVLLAAGIGAYTHFRVVPALERGAAGGQQDPAHAHLRRGTVVETVVFGGIVVATAILVASSVHV